MKYTAEHKERRALALELWRDGRSVAGIILEISREYGYKLGAAQVLGMIRRARMKDSRVPPAAPSPTGDALDVRAASDAPQRMGRAANVRHKWHDSGESEGVPCR